MMAARGERAKRRRTEIIGKYDAHRLARGVH
jgi:hypothetical protein